MGVSPSKKDVNESSTRRITWTTEKPTQSGWYRWREESLPLIGVIVQVDAEADTVYS